MRRSSRPRRPATARPRDRRTRRPRAWPASRRDGGDRSTIWPMASQTASAHLSSQVTSQARPPGPCSACSTTSVAAAAGGQVASAITTISDGPANAEATPTSPATSCLAVATQAFPGPATTSAGRIVSVPYASAATACTPPTRCTSVTPAQVRGGQHRRGKAGRRDRAASTARCRRRQRHGQPARSSARWTG